MNFNSRRFSVEEVDDTSCSTGLKQNVAAVLACIFGVVFVFVESRNRFVRYCAVQSLFLWAAWMLLFVVLSVLSAFPLVGLVFELIRALISLGLTLALGGVAYLAYHGKKVIVPFVSRYAEDWSVPDE